MDTTSAHPARGERSPEVSSDSYSDPEVLALLDRTRPRLGEVARGRQIFANRNMRMDRIELIGFDMDYTLAIYHLRRLEKLAFDMTLRRMIDNLGYPSELQSVQYDPEFVTRGLVIDKQTGNILKTDRHNHCGRSYHGRHPLPETERRRLYREEKVRLSQPRFAWIDSLFALPEAALFAEIIEYLESKGGKVEYAALYDHIRESIDMVHRDDSLKEIVKRDLEHYLVKDPDLAPSLHKLRSAGKKLFLLTNSYWEFTQDVMGHLLDGVLPEYPSWKNYFDIIVTGAMKPAFFSERRPCYALSPTGERTGEAPSFERGVLYEGGNLAEFERLAGIGGDRVLYVGDHLYGDILLSKKSSLWRTCMIVQELETELAWLEQNQSALEEMSRLEELRMRLNEETSLRKAALSAIDRRMDRESLSGAARIEIEAERKGLKLEFELLRRALRDANLRIGSLQQRVEEGYNRYWGLVFKEGNENSRFAEQVEDYACVYTSRVSNFVLYSPVQYFHSLRATMPHERSTLRMASYWR